MLSEELHRRWLRAEILGLQHSIMVAANVEELALASRWALHLRHEDREAWTLTVSLIGTRFLILSGEVR
jgi:hypothetical protein